LEGKYIMEGVCVLHEVLHELHKNKQARMLFKMDFAKAFDKIKWPFLAQVLELKRFPRKYLT
jgi:hypothetical protein